MNKPMACPECDYECDENDLIAQANHMLVYHPDVIATRRARAYRWDGWEDE